MSVKNEIQVPPPAARRSLNEIEVMGKRAARGGGLPWGLAEEAGKAARWLTARGLPGVEQLADILTDNDKRLYVELAPAEVDGVWQASSRQLCPLITGAAVCDLAAEIAKGRVIELGATMRPLLLAPYVAGAAKLTGVAVVLDWDDVKMTLTPDGMAIEGNRDALMARGTERVRCRRADEQTNVPASEFVNEPAVPAAAWARLAALAQRTFAPATEASRLSGAGAGLSDNN
ncbi:MAG: DUF3726 domain-containing protein [Geminicoccaceae bacterium]